MSYLLQSVYLNIFYREVTKKVFKTYYINTYSHVNSPVIRIERVPVLRLSCLPQDRKLIIGRNVKIQSKLQGLSWVDLGLEASGNPH